MLASLIVVILCIHTSCGAKLYFRNNEEFKIAIFADLHFGEGENTEWGPQQDVKSTHVMKTILKLEKPDLVIYSGDQITGENILSNATSYWSDVVTPCVETNTPWASVFGNHDDLSKTNGTREELLAKDMSYNLSYSQSGPDNIHGLTNYFIPIYPNETTEVPCWILYVLDSGGGSYPELVYDDQITWFKTVANNLRKTYGVTLPSIAFFHIPSDGYGKMFHSYACSGTQNDTVSPQIRPNDLLTTLHSSGNVHATFVGHNHGNDWCCPQSSGLLVCYARHTGYGGYGTWQRGSRQIVLNQHTFKTYVRMESGEIHP